MAGAGSTGLDAGAAAAALVGRDWSGRSIRVSARYFRLFMLRPSHLFGREVDGAVDLGVIGATAQVPGQGLLDLLERRIRVLPEERRRGHEKAGSAVAALVAVLLDEGLLDRMELVAFGQAFDRPHGLSIGPDREGHAGVDGFAVEKDGAAAAFAPVANLLGAREVELVAQDVEQGLVGLDFERRLPAVDRQRDRFAGKDRDLALAGRDRLAEQGLEDGRADGARAHALDEIPTRDAGAKVIGR